MFEKFTPVIQKILQQLKDVLTTTEQRAIVESKLVPESLTMPYNERLWNWDTYFKYLSYRGLEESPGFKALFPQNSNALHNYNQYLAIGKKYLD